MSSSVDLLLITWNRREYIEKSLTTLLSHQSDFVFIVGIMALKTERRNLFIRLKILGLLNVIFIPKM